MKIQYIEVTQPIGSFYLSVLPAKTLVSLVEVKTRLEDISGIQRELSQKRASEISLFCSDPDAVFPTAIIISVYKDSPLEFDYENHSIFIKDNCGKIGEVIDGQHRLKGLSMSSNIDAFELPVVFLFDLDEGDRAFVFSIINSKQTKVSSSLIYDLFELSKDRSPQSVIHKMARSLNESPSSPFYGRIKMLGKKSFDEDEAVLSQGTFVTKVLPLVSKRPEFDAIELKNSRQLIDDPHCPLRRYFIEGRDEIILKIITNCFNALKIVFPTEWKDPKNNILWKTTGFGGVIKAFPELYKDGKERKDLSQTYFINRFEAFKARLEAKDVKLDKSHFPGGSEALQKAVCDMILDKGDQND